MGLPSSFCEDIQGVHRPHGGVMGSLGASTLPHCARSWTDSLGLGASLRGHIEGRR